MRDINSVTASWDMSEWMIGRIEDKKEDVKWNSHAIEIEKMLSNYGREIQFHVSEIYSRPRVCKMAQRMRLIPGFSL